MNKIKKQGKKPSLNVAQPVKQSRPRALLRMQRRQIKSSGEPWRKIVSDWFQQKTIKVFLIGPFKFARERLNVWRVWRVSGFFLRLKCLSKHYWPILYFRFQNNICTTNWAGFSNFQIKQLSYISKIETEKDLNVKK